jgi:hypothetical protein
MPAVHPLIQKARISRPEREQEEISLPLTLLNERQTMKGRE